MNPGRFFLPSMTTPITPFVNVNHFPNGANLGFLGRIGSSIKRINWSGMLNNANKTLNVVNQTIPLVRQAGPMFNNMKSMFKIAKLFGNETNSGQRNATNNTSLNKLSSISNDDDNIIKQKKEVINENYPNFFV